MNLRTRLALLASPIGTAAAMPAAALTYTVGSGGTYSTIQAAINAALAHAGDDAVRVHTGIYNRLRAGSPYSGAFGGYESYWSLNGQAVATFSDSLVAKSPLIAAYAYVRDTSHVNLVNLTLADNASDVYINSTSSNTSSTSNCLIAARSPPTPSMVPCSRTTGTD